MRKRNWKRAWSLLAIMILMGGCSMQEDNSMQEDISWKLVWSDEFDGEKLDAGKWTYDLGNGFTTSTGDFVAGWGNGESEYYTNRPDNARVEDNRLRITALKESCEGFGYTSARIKTKGFSATYGKYEIRAKLPAGKGLWPAIWMLPEQGAYGGWAASGEIDIMEAKGSLPSKMSGAIHYGGAWPNNVYTTKEYDFPDGQTIADYHVYSLEWEPEEIRWHVDGKLFQKANEWYSSGADGTRRPYPAPFDQPFHLLINLAVGGHFDGEPDDTTVFPAVMEVDYVRVYQLAVGR